MGWFLDKKNNEVHQTSDVLLPGGAPTRMNRRVRAHPDRYKELTDKEVEAHLRKVEKNAKETGENPLTTGISTPDTGETKGA